MRHNKSQQALTVTFFLSFSVFFSSRNARFCTHSHVTKVCIVAKRNNFKQDAVVLLFEKSDSLSDHKTQHNKMSVLQVVSTVAKSNFNHDDTCAQNHVINFFFLETVFEVQGKQVSKGTRRKNSQMK